MIYKDLTFQKERSLYNIKDSKVINCVFEGKEDGESPLKECENIFIDNSTFNLRYPFWHNKNVSVSNSILKDNCRAPIWYCKDFSMFNCESVGVKPVRECNGVSIIKSNLKCLEFGWKSKDIMLLDSTFEGEYFLFESKNVKMNNCQMKGKYSFQYMDNLEIDNCVLDTKDAFWHSKNVVVTNSTLKGEYIGWYSKNVSLINCTIIGTQPFCYCKKLKLINCKFIDADYAFEYSDVNAHIVGSIDSIKNPLKGKIVVDDVKEIILEDYKVVPKAKIIVTNKEKGEN